MDHKESTRLKINKPVFFISLFFILILYCIVPVFGADVNITDIDETVGQSLGLNGTDAQVVGGTVISSIVLLMFLVPTAVLTKGKSELAIAVSIVMPLVLCVGFSWLDVWVLLLVVLLVSGFFARKVVSAVN